MKRTGFKQKKTVPMKRGTLKKKSPQKISILKRKLWTVFSKFIRERDKYTCFICGRKGEGGGIHAGHFIPKSVCGIELYFHEDNVHACCYHCNINLGGNLYEYSVKLGKEKVDELYRIKNQVTSKWSVEKYLEMIQKYDSNN